MSIRMPSVWFVPAVALLLSLPPILEKTLPKGPYHDLVWLLSTVPIALGAYARGFKGSLVSGVASTILVWFLDFNIAEYRKTGHIEMVVPFLTAYNLMIALGMGLLAKYLKEQGRALEHANKVLSLYACQDHLTGLYNCRQFHNSLEQACLNASAGMPVSLIFIDIDGFKSLNDRYGHQAGDAILTRVSQCIRETVRHSDIPCRYGGDEFAVILPDTDSGQARETAERIRNTIREQGEVFCKALDQGNAGAMEPITPTVSVGIATFPGQADSAEALVRLADMALYCAKSKGRDCSITAS